MKRVLSSIVFAGVFTIPFIPLVVADGLFFPFITGKNFLFRILVEIMFGAWVALALIDPAYRPKFSNKLLVSVLAFTGIIAVANLFGEYPFKSFWSNYERMEGWVTLAHLAAYFIVLGNIVKEEKWWNRLLHTTIGVSVIAGIYGLFQFAGLAEIHQSGTRLDASFGNSTYFAIYMIFHFFLTLFVAVRYRGLPSISIPKITYGVIAVLQLIIIYFTETRGAILGLVGGILLLALLVALFYREGPRVRRVAAISLIMLTVCISGFIALRDHPIMQKSNTLARLASISLEEKTTRSRFMVWNMAWEGFKERPVLGWGQENFNYVFNKYYNPGMYDQEQWFDRTHNVIFDWAIAGGALGLVGYMSLYGFALYLLWKKTDLSFFEKGIITALFAAHFVHNLFVFDNLTSYILFFTVLAFVYGKTFGGDDMEVMEPRPEVVRVAVPLALVGTVVVMYAVNASGYFANKSLIRALTELQTTGPQVALESFKKVLSYDSFGNPEIREQLSQAAISVAGAEGISGEIKNQFVQLAGQEMRKQIMATPNDARYQLFMGSFLSRIGQGELAQEYLQKASDLSPRKQSILIEIGANKIGLGKYEEGYMAFKKAYELAPQFVEPKIILTAGALYAGRGGDAESLLQSLTVVERADPRILQAYDQQKQYGIVISILTDASEADPENARYKISLAAAYSEDGQKAKAIEVLQNLKLTHPELGTEIDQYLAELESN